MSERAGSNFLREIIKADLQAGTHGGQVVTRFPPEPNGYLHIGHAKAICVDFGLAAEFGGRCNLRMDDTNPEKEDAEYIESIKQDVQWLGFDWGEGFFHASDYFERMVDCAEHLIREGKAFVCFQSVDEMREARGTVKLAGSPSPWRDASVEDNLAAFHKMKAGEFPDGHCVLRAKIDLAASNMKLRDPPLYRIRRATHPHTGDAWCIYPMYDFAHPLEDAFEGITHSICTLEFQDNRELYDWVVDNCPIPSWAPRQYEMARLNLAYTVMSKRKLAQLVADGLVEGWDDPRLPTLAGLRRRGVPPEAIRLFCDRIGVAKADSLVDPALLDFCIREVLNHQAPRVMAVLDPLELVIDNWTAGTDWLEAPLWPHDVPNEGSRRLPFSGRLFIEREDFSEQPPSKWRRLAPGVEVRLRYGYLVTCTGVDRDADGRVTRVRCTYDPDSRGGNAPDGRKVTGTLHWVSAEHAVTTPVRLVDRLFTVERPDDVEEGYLSVLNPDSTVRVTAMLEPWLDAAELGARFQFERLGYFIKDRDGGYNRVVSLKDRWKKVEDKPVARKQAVQGEAKARSLSDRESTRAEALSKRGLGREQAEVLATNPQFLAFFEAAVRAGGSDKRLANLVTGPLMREAKDPGLENLRIQPAQLAELARLIDSGEISTKIGKQVFAEVLASGQDPSVVVQAQGLKTVSDEDALRGHVQALVEANAGKVEAYRGGRTGLLGFFVGGVMKATRGKADPKLVQELVREALDG